MSVFQIWQVVIHSLLEVSHGKTQRRFICVASFQKTPHNIKTFKNKYAIKQVAMQLNDS